MRTGANRRRPQDRYSFALHGGTVSDPNHVTGAQLDLIRIVVTEAGVELASGTSALDSVVSAIVKLEDSGLLDAGKGSYLNAAGFVENDASLMQGNTGNAGAVAAMPRLRNPIVAARIAAVPGSEWLLMAESGSSNRSKLSATKVRYSSEAAVR